MALQELEYPGEKIAIVGGLGVISPIGNDEHTFFRRLNNGEHGIQTLVFPEYPYSKVKVAGVVEGFEEEDWERLLVDGNIIDPSDFDFYSKSTFAALEVTRQALAPFTVFQEVDGRMAPRLNPDIFDPNRIGLVLAAEGGGIVEETLRTHERIMSRNERVVRSKLATEIRGHLLDFMSNEESSLQDEVGELVEIFQRFMYDKTGDRLGLKATTESIIRGLVDTPLGAITRAFGIHGPSVGVYSACASGEDAVAVARAWLLNPQSSLDGVIVVTSEFSNNYPTRSQFEATTALSTIEDPNKTPRPFDKGADGFVTAEAASSKFLVREGFAKEHNLPVRARHLASAAYDEGYSMTAPLPNGEGTYMAMSRLWEKRVGGRRIEDILKTGLWWMKMHGTGTGGDGFEITGARRAIEWLKKTLAGFSSIKGATGHSLSAAAGVEYVAAIKATEEGEIPPNIKCDNPIKETEGLPLIRQATAAPIEFVVTLANGFGGHQRAGVIQSAKSTI